MERKVAQTDLNNNSSRSHAIIVLTCIKTNQQDKSNSAAQMLLIDLAGTENIGKSGAQGDRIIEAGNINQSLLALGNVINDIIEID